MSIKAALEMSFRRPLAVHLPHLAGKPPRGAQNMLIM
jgi:hypothetical protein